MRSLISALRLPSQLLSPPQPLSLQPQPMHQPIPQLTLGMDVILPVSVPAALIAVTKRVVQQWEGFGSSPVLLVDPQVDVGKQQDAPMRSLISALQLPSEPTKAPVIAPVPFGYGCYDPAVVNCVKRKVV